MAPIQLFGDPLVAEGVRRILSANDLRDQLLHGPAADPRILPGLPAEERRHGKHAPAALDVFVPDRPADGGFVELQLLRHVLKGQSAEGAAPQERRLPGRDHLAAALERGVPAAEIPHDLPDLLEFFPQIGLHSFVLLRLQHPEIGAADVDPGEIGLLHGDGQTAVELSDAEIRRHIQGLFLRRKASRGVGTEGGDHGLCRGNGLFGNAHGPCDPPV